MPVGEQELVCYWWDLTVKGHFVPDRHWDRHLLCSLSLPKWSAPLPKASLYRRRERRHGDVEGVITWLRSHRKGVVFLPFPSLWSRLAQSSGSLLNPHLKSGFPWVFLSASESLLPEYTDLGSSIFDFFLSAPPPIRLWYICSGQLCFHLAFASRCTWDYPWWGKYSLG